MTSRDDGGTLTTLRTPTTPRHVHAVRFARERIRFDGARKVRWRMVCKGCNQELRVRRS